MRARACEVLAFYAVAGHCGARSVGTSISLVLSHDDRAIRRAFVVVRGRELMTVQSKEERRMKVLPRSHCLR